MAWATPQKFVGAILGAAPMVAGLTLWVAIGGWQEMWRYSQLSPRRRAAIGVDTDGAFVIAAIVTALCVVLHVGTGLMTWWVGGRLEFFSLSATAWRVLFAACYVTGLLLGALIYFSAPK
jgi:hypothetical protein